MRLLPIRKISRQSERLALFLTFCAGYVDAYTFIVEMRDITGATRVKRFRVFYISRELERVCVARTDVTDVVLKEQRQKEELAAAPC